MTDRELLEMQKDAERWRFWKDWWMHDVDGSCYHLPDSVIALLEDIDLDEAMDEAIARRKEGSNA